MPDNVEQAAYVAVTHVRLDLLLSQFNHGPELEPRGLSPFFHLKHMLDSLFHLASITLWVKKSESQTDFSPYVTYQLSEEMQAVDGPVSPLASYLTESAYFRKTLDTPSHTNPDPLCLYRSPPEPLGHIYKVSCAITIPAIIKGNKDLVAARLRREEHYGSLICRSLTQNREITKH